MNAKKILTIIAVSTLAAAPVFAASPFGFLDGKTTGGNGATGVVPLVGWALDDDGVRAVDIYVDGVIAGRAHYGRNRPGVTRHFPGYPDSDAAGFAFQLNSTHYLNGVHEVQAQVVSQSGERTYLNAVQILFTNTTHLLAPFGEIEFPRPSAELYGTCDLAASPRRLTAVLGWTLDAGVEIGDMGVGYVELLIDGSIFANSRVDCIYSNTLENRGLTECYGLRRLDIEKLFPNLANAPQAGFRFVMDIGHLIDWGYAEGQHVLTIRVGDIAGQVSDVAEIPVSFQCDNRIGNEEGFGWIARLEPINIVDGVAHAQGWALDWEGVARVEVFVDGSLLGDATYGRSTPAIALQYPGYPSNTHAGWDFSFNTNELADGRHDLQAILIDSEGQSTLLGERSFVIDNSDD